MNEYFAELVENYYNQKLESDKIFHTTPRLKAVNNQRRLASEFLRNPYEDLNGAGGHALEAILFHCCNKVLKPEYPRINLVPAPAELDYSKSKGMGFDYIAEVDFYNAQIIGYVSATLSRENPAPPAFKGHKSGKLPPHIGLSSSLHGINHAKLTTLCLSSNQEKAWLGHIEQISPNVLTAFGPIINFANFHHWNV